MTKSNKIILVILIAAVLTAAICYIVFYGTHPNVTQQNQPEQNTIIIQPKNYVQLLFVGDLMFDRGIRYYAQKGGSNKFIFEKISAELLKNDLVIANLEGPITGNKSVSAGTAIGSTNNYFFTFDPSVAQTLADENIKIVNLGNNHILNFGQAGLDSTEKYLQSSNISYFGAPGGVRSLEHDISGVKVAFVSYNEFNGVYEIEKSSALNEIKKNIDNIDIVVVFCHWGVEYAKNSTEAQKELAHEFIDGGADLVIGSHPHVTQPSEEYNGKMIYYSLGNFIFDQYFNDDVRNGLGVVVKIDKTTKKLDFSEKHFYLESNGQTSLK